MTQKYTPGELILFLDGPRLIDGSDLNHNFELLFYPESRTRHITPAQSPYTVLPTDQVILCDTTLGNIALFLPDARFYLEQILAIKKNDQSANTVTVKPISGDTVDKTYTNSAPYIMSAPNQSVILTSDFVSDWPIIATSGIPTFGKLVSLTAANSPYTMTQSDGLIICDTSAGNIAITLVSANSYAYLGVTVVNKGTGTVSLSSASTILGSTSLPYTNQSVTYQSDAGTTWYST